MPYFRAGSGKPTPVLLPGKFHGWRSLVGYSPSGRKESDTTERLYLHLWSDPSKELCFGRIICIYDVIQILLYDPEFLSDE